MFSNDCLIELTFLFFLLYFWLFLIARTTFQPFRILIIYLIYYSSIIVPWGFSCHLCVVDCWYVCLRWSYHRSLIMKRFLECVIKVSASRIQTGHADLLPHQVCGRLWWGCWYGVILVRFNGLILLI